MTAPAAARPTAPKLTIAGARCVHRRAAAARCRACALACPPAAWTIDAGGLVFDDTHCDGCGLCAAACPTGALAVSLVWPAPRLAPDGVRRVELSCERAAAAGGRPLPCVHAVDEAQLLRWHAQGVGSLHVTSGDCAACERRRPEGLPERLQRLNDALRWRGQRGIRLERGGAPGPAATAGRPAPAPLPPTAASTAALPESRPPQPARRGFLLGLRRQPAAPERSAGPPATAASRNEATTADAAAAPAATTAAAPRREAVRRLERLGPGPALWAAAFDPGRCDACGACARLCPTQAIVSSAATTGGAGALVFEMAHCVGCGLCVDVCEPGALAPSAALRTPGSRRTFALTSRSCPGCGKAYRVLLGAADPTAVPCPACRGVAARRSDRIVHAPSSPPGGLEPSR